MFVPGVPRSGLGDEPTHFPWWLHQSPAAPVYAPAPPLAPIFVASPSPSPAPAPAPAPASNPVAPPSVSTIPAVVQNADGSLTVTQPISAPVAPELLSQNFDPDPGGTSGFLSDPVAGAGGANQAGFGWIAGGALLLLLFGSMGDDDNRKG